MCSVWKQQLHVGVVAAQARMYRRVLTQYGTVQCSTYTYLSPQRQLRWHKLRDELQPRPHSTHTLSLLHSAAWASLSPSLLLDRSARAL